SRSRHEASKRALYHILTDRQQLKQRRSLLEYLGRNNWIIALIIEYVIWVEMLLGIVMLYEPICVVLIDALFMFYVD
uniref:Uncharacterized protein n=1 Tax=Ciona intestinalis TaxID=7719 RepID=H2XXA2_CIOIN